jgi:transcriptional regulator with PAS, ATPase and Fis domain
VRGQRERPEDLPLRLQNQVAAPDVTEGDTLAGILAGVEKRIIAEALALEENNRTRTAARLGITRKILLAKIAAYRLE